MKMRAKVAFVAIAIALAMTLYTIPGVGQQSSTGPVAGQTNMTSTVDRLYVLDGGVGHSGNANSWSNNIDLPGTPIDIAAPCHLIRHRDTWVMFDTCPNDIIASMPNGYGTAAGAIRWVKNKTVKAQLDQLGIKPDDIKYIALSHNHADHSGNVYQFPNSIVLIQEVEYEDAFSRGRTPGGPPNFAGQVFPRQQPVKLLDGDFDVFGDGSMVLFWVGGHTRGQQVALVRLRNTGPIILSGDAVHTQANWDNRRTPRLQGSNDENQWRITVGLAYQRIADLLSFYKAQLWIHHDVEQYKKKKYVPEFYD
ncbi:MAG: N-acyl homoserine lactonase family protein [Acidobacteria bacterium]|nr:N-acyl homoserine lactonase family protein [Acidobacteriota bacterium]